MRNKQSQVSLSAWVVIACHLALNHTRRWQPIIPQQQIPFYMACDAYCRKRFILCRLLGALPSWAKIRLVYHLVANGAPQHYVLRKAAIAKQVHQCLAQGTKQLVVLGGGFDMLALAVAQSHGDVECFEFDRPSMHRHKVEIIASCGGSAPKNFHAIGIDFTQSTLTEMLLAHPHFNASLPTVFVAEGVTMYLSEQEVQHLFEGLKQCCQLPAAFIFTAIEIHRNTLPKWAESIRNKILRLGKERYAWSIARSDIPDFLQKSGFTQHYLIPYAELQRPWRTENEMLSIERQNGEYIVYSTFQTA